MEPQCSGDLLRIDLYTRCDQTTRIPLLISHRLRGSSITDGIMDHRSLEAKALPMRVNRQSSEGIHRNQKLV